MIGSTRLAYDYWGDTMNIASRLQGAAPLNGVAVSEATYFQVRTIQEYEPQTVVLKGIGETAALCGRRLDGQRAKTVLSCRRAAFAARHGSER